MQNHLVVYLVVVYLPDIMTYLPGILPICHDYDLFAIIFHVFSIQIDKIAFGTS